MTKSKTKVKRKLTKRVKDVKEVAKANNIPSVLREDKLISGLKLLAWNMITLCSPSCRLFDRCGNKNDGKGCKVEGDYMEHVLNPVFKYLEKDLDEYDLVELGFKYMRLHHNLIRVQKEILSMDVYKETKYGIKVNPLFAEERSLLNAIESLDINRLLRKRVKGKVREISSGIALKGEGAMKVIEVLDGSNTDYTDRLAGNDEE